MIRRRILCVAVMAAAVLACGDEGGPGTPGTLVLSVNTPHSDDTGILLSVSGPGIDHVNLTGSNQVVYWRLTGENEARVLLLGDLTSGPIVKFDVPNTRQVADYTATVLDVTDRNNAMRTDLDAYQVAVTREQD